MWWAASAEIGGATRRSAKAKQFLIELSGHPQPRLRERAAPGLGAAAERDEESARRLTALAQDPDPAVRRRVGEAAGAFCACAARSGAIIDQLIGEGDAGTRAGLAWGLGRALGAGNSDALPVLVRLLADDPAAVVRAAAAEALGSATGEEALPAVKALGDVAPGGDPAARLAAARALARLSALRPRAALAGLRTLASAADPLARGSAAVALADARGGRALLEALAGDRSAVVRAQAVRSLGARAARGERWSIVALKRLLADRDHTVRSAAAEAVGSAVGDCAEAWQLASGILQRREDEVRGGVAAGLATSSADPARVMPLLTVLARDRAPAVRAAAARGLGRLADSASREATAALQDALSDPDPLIRQSALLGVAQRDKASAELLERLIAMAEDSAAAVRQAALLALGQAAGESPELCLPALLRLAADPWLRDGAVEPVAGALSVMGPRALRHLQRLVDLSPDGQWLAALGAAVEMEALGEFLGAVGTALSGPDLWESVSCAARWARELGPEGRALADALSRAAEMAGAADTSAIGHFAKLRLGADSPLASALAAMSEVAGLVAQAGQAERGDERAEFLSRAEAALSAIEPASDLNAVESRMLDDIALTWRTVISAAEEVLQTRAEVRVHLPAAITVVGPTATLGLRIENVGMTTARDVTLRIDDAATPVVQMASLEPEQWGETEVALPVAARLRRLETQAQLRYRDDSGERTLRLPVQVGIIRPRRAFRPLANPFAPGKPLPIESPMFYGREDAFEFLRQNLKGAYHENIVALIGQRRCGKTSILRRIPAALGDRYVAVFLDAQGLLVDSVSAFFHEIASRAAEVLGEDRIALPSLDDFRRQPERLADARLLQALGRLAGDRRLLVLLDEYDDLETKVRSGLLPESLFDGLRHLMQHSPQVAFVLSGTHRLEELGKEYWSFLFNLALYHRIGPLDPIAARSLLAESFDRAGLLVDELAIERLLSLCGRWPYFLQLAGHHLVLRCNRLGRNVLTAADLNDSLDGINEWGEAHLRYLWTLADDAERGLLRALARLPGPATADELAREVNLSSGGVAASLDRMVAKELLTVVGTRAPRYWFQMELLRVWIAQGAALDR